MPADRITLRMLAAQAVRGTVILACVVMFVTAADTWGAVLRELAR